MKTLFTCTYGSHLYGTSTPTSDTDRKVVYLPEFDDVLLGKKLSIFKTRVDADGRPLTDGESMPANGVEVEHIPFQTFCRDFLNGQTYAIEVAHAHWSGASPVWLNELIEDFSTSNVSSMAGFAVKQTWDYVHRAKRLKQAERLLDSISYWSAELDDLAETESDRYAKKRMDTVLPDGVKVLHSLAADAGAELGETTNNGKVMQTLKLNGRDYLETTSLRDMEVAVAKLVSSYGARTGAAAEKDLDLKSLSHAVRVFEQAKELLQTGRVTFPRPEAAYLLKVKNGEANPEEVKARLVALELEVTRLQDESSLPKKTPDLEKLFDGWLLLWLRELYWL
jgi:RNA repair pathway DNA polymerase beta family